MIGVTVLSVFLVGLLGGLHCAGMCGGIVAVMGAARGGQDDTPDRARASVIRIHPVATRRPMGLLLGYNAGRISSYTLAGLLAGALGTSAALLHTVLPIQQIVFVAANLLLIALGLHLAGMPRLLSPLEGLGSGLWQRLQPLASRSLAAHTPAQAYRAGLVWGWVPCGMVYGVLMAALVSGSAPRGAALMLAFGLGTLPNLLLLGASAAKARRWLARPRWRIAAGVVITGFGLAGLARLDPTRHLHRVIDACLTLL